MDNIKARLETERLILRPSAPRPAGFISTSRRRSSLPLPNEVETDYHQVDQNGEK